MPARPADAGPDEPRGPVYFIHIADMKAPGDPEGRTYRQVNAAKVHAIPLGALVEVNCGEPCDGIRLFVVYHGRDCDQTPLYYLSADPGDVTKEDPRFSNRGWTGGYSEGCLTVIRTHPGGGPPAAGR